MSTVSQSSIIQRIADQLPGIVATAAGQIGVKLSDATVQRIAEVLREMLEGMFAEAEFRAAVKAEASAQIHRELQRFMLATGSYRNGPAVFVREIRESNQEKKLMTASNLTQFRAITRRASTFEAAVESLLEAGVASKGQAIRLVQKLNGRLWNEWTAKRHPAVQRMVISR